MGRCRLARPEAGGGRGPTSYGTPALKVRGKLLTRLRPEDDSLVLPDVPLDERDMLIDADPGTFHTTPHYDGYPIVLARLDALEPARLMPFLERRWRGVAPRRLVIDLDASRD
ncbi:MmcQ/YjbR family DNA-binding protein [Methylobacterium longum]|uniref:MmcQ/YjbR family DNA-binding protein n=2 Tax=Methylobacterium longum TaxID=767694 RepID=A0ABT8ARX9_9HYPH|nr:MmcQ/YjbR family DNA-binding protein [Methylobacterium longum]MDN3572191.1 MmcQ/YjbR family DNA-binding protein [Methylobacterium longum]